MSQLKLYDNTRIGAARSCMRYYLLRHVYHWTADSKSTPLIFGSSWHEAMDVTWARHSDLYATKAARTDVIESAHQAFINEWVANGMTHPDDMTPDDIDDLGARTPATALEMLHHYPEAREHLFKAKSFELLGIEEPFIVPLDPNDQTKFYVGRLDKRIRQGKQQHVYEHKTTTMYRISGTFSSDWIDSWSMDDQVDGYNYAMHLKYDEEAGGSYIDGALVHKKVHDGFKTIPIDKHFDQLQSWLYDTHTWIAQIERNTELYEETSQLDTPYLAAFPRNRKSCVSVYGRCQFFDYCRMNANPARTEGVPIGFKVEKWEPFEELGLEKLLPEYKP